VTARPFDFLFGEDFPLPPGLRVVTLVTLLLWLSLPFLELMATFVRELSPPSHNDLPILRGSAIGRRLVAPLCASGGGLLQVAVGQFSQQCLAESILTLSPLLHFAKHFMHGSFSDDDVDDDKLLLRLSM
jgi:hypothetical protein